MIGHADFDNFFGQSRIFKDTLTAEDAVQLMDPLDSVIYCKKHGFEYPKEFFWHCAEVSIRNSSIVIGSIRYRRGVS